MPSLSILIATVPERQAEFWALQLSLLAQAAQFKEQVEIVYDNRPRANQLGGVSIGQKRNDLLARATKTHVVFFDDDDLPKPWYVADIMKALETDPDSVGQFILHTSNGRRVHSCVHSMRFKTWSNGPVYTSGFGMVYQRGTGHRNPIRRTIALQVGFPDLKWGEDQPFGDGVTALCKTEVMVKRPAFTYRFSSKEPHNVKYGIE